MNALGYYNGTYGPLDEMTVPMNDRACYFGDGVYEAAVGMGNVIYDLDAHTDRMYASAQLLRIKMPHDREELKDILVDLVSKVDPAPLFMVYWQVSRATGRREHPFPKGDAPGNLWVTVQAVKEQPKAMEYRLITLPDTRFLHCNIKTLNLIPNVMALQQAVEAGCQEAVFHRDGRVTECARSNISIIKEGVFRTAPADNYILGGIARRNLLAACHKLGIPSLEAPFTVGEMMDADEVVVSSTGRFCVRVCEIDGQPVGKRDAERFQKLYQYVMEDFFSIIGMRTPSL